METCFAIQIYAMLCKPDFIGPLNMCANLMSLGVIKNILNISFRMAGISLATGPGK